MLRALALALLLGNVLLWAYLHGHLALLGLPAHDPREPERLTQQVQPELLRVLNAADAQAAPEPTDAAATEPAAPGTEATSAAPAPATRPRIELPAPPPAAPAAPAASAAPAAAEPTWAASAPTALPRTGPMAAAATATAAVVFEAAPGAPSAAVQAGTAAPSAAPTAPAAAGARPGAERACWQASGLSPPEAALVRAALEARPDLAGRWNLSEVRVPARWLVYIGPLASEAALQRRRAELTRAEIEHRSLPPPLAPGLALGTFSARDGAERALAMARARGVTDARVLQERPEGVNQRLLLSAISSAERREIEAKAILPPGALRPCP